MKKIKLYIAASLNGKIATSDGSVNWLNSIPNPNKIDYGYNDFIKTIDTTLQGYTTYHQIISWGVEFPYATKKNYVLTTKQDLQNTEHVEFIASDHIAFIKRLKEDNGGDIWLIGGGKVNTLLLNHDLIDEIQMFVMPVILFGGIEVFEHLPNEKSLKLLGTKSYSTGAIELRYKV